MALMKQLTKETLTLPEASSFIITITIILVLIPTLFDALDNEFFVVANACSHAQLSVFLG